MADLGTRQGDPSQDAVRAYDPLKYGDNSLNQPTPDPNQIGRLLQLLLNRIMSRDGPMQIGQMPIGPPGAIRPNIRPPRLNSGPESGEDILGVPPAANEDPMSKILSMEYALGLLPKMRASGR